MQNKMLQTKRRQFSVVQPVDGYRIGRKVNRVRKCLKLWRVNVLSSEISDLEGVGSERLVLWKMTAKDMEELQQQIKQEALHKKRENIMPLTMQMSKDQIEKAYHSITKQWNDVDSIDERQVLSVCDDEERPDDCSDLEEENNNAEDADERNLTRWSDVGSACGILENCDLESVVRTDLDELLTSENIRSAELSCDRDDNVDQKSLLSFESTEEVQTHCDLSSSKEQSGVDLACVDDSVSVQAEQNEHLQSELEPCGIRNSENDEQHDEISFMSPSDPVDEVIELSFAGVKDQIMDSGGSGCGSYTASLCQAVDLIPEQKRVKLDEGDACSRENKAFDLIAPPPSVTEVQQKSAGITAGGMVHSSAESECGDAYLKQISDHGSCNRVESHGDIGSGKPLEYASLDLCRTKNYEQPCGNKRPRRGKSAVNRRSLDSRLSTVGNRGENVNLFQSRALATSDCESSPLLVNQAELNHKIYNPKAALESNDSYTKICTKRRSCPVNCNDDCHSGDFLENSAPAESEHMISDMKTNPDNIVDEVSLPTAALVLHNGNSCAESLLNNGLSKNIDTDKNDSKPISKPGNCQTIKLCEVDLFCREKRKLNSPGSLKFDEFGSQLNCEHVQQNKEIRKDRVKPLKKRIGQKGITTAVDLVQSPTKDFSGAVKKSVADTNKSSNETKELLLTLESTVCPVEKAESTDIPADDSKHHDGISNFQCGGQQNSVMESNTRLDSECDLAGISSRRANKPETCLPSDRADEQLASLIEFNMNFTQLSTYKSKKNLYIENHSLKVSNCSINQDAVVDESLLDDQGFQMERLDYPRHLHPECSNDTVSRTNVTPISDILSLIDSQHCNSTVSEPAKDYDHDDFGCLQMVPCTNSNDGIEMVSHMYDAQVKDKSSQKETSPAHATFETSRAPEEMSSQNFVNIRESCHVDDVCGLENDVSRILNDSCKSDICGTLKTCILGVKKEISPVLDSFDSQSPGCGDLPAVAGDDEKICSVDIISPIHSPSPCRSSFVQNDSGVHDIEKSDPQQSPIIIPLTVGDQVTRDLLDCLRTARIRLLSESDEGFSNS